MRASWMDNDSTQLVKIKMSKLPKMISFTPHHGYDELLNPVYTDSVKCIKGLTFLKRHKKVNTFNIISLSSYSYFSIHYVRRTLNHLSRRHVKILLILVIRIQFYFKG